MNPSKTSPPRPRTDLLPPRNLVILGSTGSIGRQALDVVRALPGRFRVVGLAAHSNWELFAAQIAEWQPQRAAMWDTPAADRVNQVLGDGSVLAGPDAVCELAALPQAHLVLTALMGAAGIQPTLQALESGKQVAVANKETLVAAGALVMETAHRYGVTIRPVDSEHSAIAQCLLGEPPHAVRKITITASGGPFVDYSRARIAAAPAAQALQHPTWTMGPKITIDSATLMNKVLESIEARWLFDVPLSQIEILVHRQSVVHSLVTLRDGSVKAQLGVPDMKLPIQWALLFPERVEGPAPILEWDKMQGLTFEEPDAERFPSLALAQEVMLMGGTAPAAMNAANEVAVQAYLQGRTTFYGITNCVQAVLARHPERWAQTERPALDDILQADAAARRLAEELLTAE